MSKISYRSLFDLTGRVAVVTGGSGILGQHFCTGLAEAGARVAVVDIQAKQAKELAKNLSNRYQVPAIGVGCDVSKSESVAEMVAYVLSEFGQIDILHNNAA